MKITKRQLKRIIREAESPDRVYSIDPLTGGDTEKPAGGLAIGGSFPGDSEDLDYFQDQVEEAYSRLAAESDDIEHLLPEHIIAKITEALNSIEQLNVEISKLRKSSEL